METPRGTRTTVDRRLVLVGVKSRTGVTVLNLILKVLLPFILFSLRIPC